MVRMKVERLFRKPRDHIHQARLDFIRHHDAQRVGQHDVRNSRSLQSLHESVDVIAAVVVPVGPVLQVHVDFEPLLAREIHSAKNVLEMLFGGSPQLHATVTLAALCQQVHHVRTGRYDPVRTPVFVYEPQDLDPLQVAFGIRPLGDPGYGLFFTRGHRCRGNLYAIDQQ